jgi:hypothetical protein
MRTLASFENDGHLALTEALAHSEWATVEQALASLTVFASPITVRELNRRPVFRIIRDLSAQRGAIDYEKRVMVDTDGNHGPIAAFCWATGFVFKKDSHLHFNHIYAESKNVELFTNLINICVTPSFLTKITDRHGASLLRYRAWELFGSPPDGEIPPKPADYDRLEWAPPLDPLSDVEDRMRHIMSTKPKDNTTRSVRELGWIFSSFEPDQSIDRPKHGFGSAEGSPNTPIRRPRDTSINNQGEAPVSKEQIRDWAGKPWQNVHRIIGIAVHSGPLTREQLVEEIHKLKFSRNPYGAVAGLMTNAGNNYGLVFVSQAGRLDFHPQIK